MGLASALATVGRFGLETTGDILTFVDPFGISRAVVGGIGTAAGITGPANIGQFVTPTEQTRMGLISAAIAAGRVLFAGGQQAIARAAPIAARIAASPVARGIGAGALTGGAIALATGGDGVAAPGLTAGIQQVLAQGGSATQLSGGRTLVTAANGDAQIFNRMGQPIRPTLIIPAGNRLPGGAVVVSTRQGGQLIGITKRRRRRAFMGEVRRVRNVLRGCKAIEAAAAPRKRRSSHA